MMTATTASVQNAGGVGRRLAVPRALSNSHFRPHPRPAGTLAALPARRHHQASLVVRASNQDFTTGPLAPSAPTVDERIKGILKLALGGIAVSLVAASGGVLIQDFSTLPCQLTPEGCTAIPLFMKVPLIATHLLTFILMPATMYVFYTRAQALKKAGAQDPFTAMVGLSYLMVAIAGEIGWHVTQEWFYVEDYSIMNFMFYFFLTTGTAGWAIGIKEDSSTTKKDEWIDYGLIATPWLAGLAYLAGSAALHTKVPIYILLCFEYAVLSYRFWNLLKDPKVFLFPFFSVGVNLYFISQLDKHQSDPILNPLFHILHDAAGTQMGVAIIATLVYLSLPANAQGPSLLGNKPDE